MRQQLSEITPQESCIWPLRDQRKQVVFQIVVNFLQSNRNLDVIIHRRPCCVVVPSVVFFPHTKLVHDGFIRCISKPKLLPREAGSYMRLDSLQA
jgi:hypothetical protein